VDLRRRGHHAPRSETPVGPTASSGDGVGLRAAPTLGGGLGAAITIAMPPAARTAPATKRPVPMLPLVTASLRWERPSLVHTLVAFTQGGGLPSLEPSKIFLAHTPRPTPRPM